MRSNHTNIPWGPVIPHEVYEGYVAFCRRQKDRLKAIGEQRRVKVHALKYGLVVSVLLRDGKDNALLEVVKRANH